MNFHLKVICFRCILLLLFVSKLTSQNLIIERYLSYPQNSFDSDTCCWRKLSRSGNYIEGANLILQYLKENKQVENKASLQWHAGQLFAMGGDCKLAKKYIKRTYSIFYKWFGGEDGQAWYYFAKANIAFLDRQRKEFNKIIELWKIKYPLDKNYYALIDLYNFWNEPYGYATNRIK